SGIMDLVTESFPDLKIARISINNRGGDNLVAIVNDAVVFRFPKSKEAENAMKNEIRLIHILKDFPVRVPEYRYFPKAGDLFAGYPMIPGAPLNEASTIGRGMMKDILAALNYLRNFGKGAARESGIPIHDAASWIKRQGDILARFQESLSEITGKGFFEELENNLNVSLLEMKEGCLSLVHGDMYRGNVLISRRHDSLNGIIDWGDALYGDYAFDIAAVTMDFAPKY
ncbi:Aminoglycoside phosphotransferase, partial [mine drainage metagenome]